MTTDRSAALALFLGSAAGLITMALHPTGHDVVSNATAGRGNILVGGIHALALLAQPLLVSGTFAITQRLRVRRDLAIAALVTFAFASLAVLIAAAASGFIAPSAVRRLAQADETTRAAAMNALHYTGLINQAFAKLHVMFSCAAIALWSTAMLTGRELSRGLGIYGVVLSAGLLLALGTGNLRLDIHGYGLVVLTQAIWFCIAARTLWLNPGTDAGEAPQGGRGRTASTRA